MRMNKTSRTNLKRSFLIDGLPKPLTRASSHLQILDNYIGETGLRLRSIRVPETKEWIRSMQQVRPGKSGGIAEITAEIFLDEEEYAQLEHLEGNEVRKNRYFYIEGERKFSFDVYLGSLWGLNVMFADLADLWDPKETFPEMNVIAEITANAAFFGRGLVGRDLEYVRAEVSKLMENGAGHRS
jgi:hypothetical protein